MKTLLLTLSCAALFAALGTRTASADVFNFSFTGSDSGSGTFTANPNGTPGQYLITNMTGTINGMTILALAPAGTYPGFGANDNLLYFPASFLPPGASQSGYFDLFGISFELGSATNFENIFYGQDFSTDPYVYNLISDPDGGTDDFLDSFTIVDTSAVGTAQEPEPSSFVLLGTGALGALGVARRRFIQ